MPGAFLDTSALAKHYHLEIGTPVVDQLWNDSSRELYVSRLSALEMSSVFAGKVRAGAIAIADFDALRRRFTADLTKTKRLHCVRLLVRHYRDAERLLHQQGAVRRLRTLDALQLAVAIELHQMNVINLFVSADRDLLATVKALGVPVLDPENP